jgi:hypothetical protein
MVIRAGHQGVADSPKIGRIWLIRLVSGHSVTVPGRPGWAGGRYIPRPGHEVLGVGGAACVSFAVSSCLTSAEQDPLIGYQALVNPDPDLDPNRVVMALRVTSTSSSAGLGLFDGKPTRTTGASAPRSGSGAAARGCARHQRASDRDTQHVDTSHAELWGVADQSAGHDRGVTDSHPSLRINPYQLCETPLVLAVVATASRHGVSGRGSQLRQGCCPGLVIASGC